MGLSVSILDRTAISAALVSNPSLRKNLRDLVQQLTKIPFSDAELDQIEHEVVRSLKLSEATRLPNRLPTTGSSIRLTPDQLRILLGIIGRFRDPLVRDRCSRAVAAARAEGRIVLA